MHPAGHAAFARRSEKKSGIYAYEQRKAARFDAANSKRFRANRAAWKYFAARPPGTGSCDLVGGQREEGRDAPAAHRAVDRGVRRGAGRFEPEKRVFRPY